MIARDHRSHGTRRFDFAPSTTGGVPAPAQVYARTGTDDAVGAPMTSPAGAINYTELDTPAVTRRRRGCNGGGHAAIGREMYRHSGVLRKQTD